MPHSQKAVSIPLLYFRVHRSTEKSFPLRCFLFNFLKCVTPDKKKIKITGAKGLHDQNRLGLFVIYGEEFMFKTSDGGCQCV